MSVRIGCCCINSNYSVVVLFGIETVALAATEGDCRQSKAASLSPFCFLDAVTLSLHRNTINLPFMQYKLYAPFTSNVGMTPNLSLVNVLSHGLRICACVQIMRTLPKNYVSLK